MHLHVAALSHIADTRPSDTLEIAAAIRRVALAAPGVRDAHVLRRTGRDGRRRVVVYLVSVEPPTPVQEDALAAACPPGEALLAVRVSDLPRDARGEVDEAALAALPVVEEPPAGDARVVPRRTLPPVDRSVRLHDPAAPAEIVAAPLPEEPTARRVLADILDHAARHAASRGAIFVDGAASRSLLHPAMADAARRAAGGLRARGLPVGAPVVVVMRDAEEAIVAFWGAVLAGLVPTPVAAPARVDATDQAARRVLDAASLFPGAALVVPDDLAGPLAALLAEAGEVGHAVFAAGEIATGPALAQPHVAAPDDVAIRFLTSGSTGKPKIVPQTHRRLLAFCLATTVHHGYTQDDVGLNWLPLDHVGGLLMCHLRDLYVGCTQVHGCYRALLRDPLLWLDWCSCFGATVTWAPNFAFALVGDALARGPLADRGWSLERLRIVFNGAEPISRRHAARFLAGLARYGLAEDAVRPVWGMSETCSGVVACTHFRKDTLAGRENPVSVGVPIPGLRLRVVDAAGNLLREGETGRLQIAGATVLDAYVDNPAAVAASFPGAGWFDTGDLATIEDGRLHIVGRDKDVVVVNGQKLETSALEARIEDVPGVRASFTAVLAARAPGADRDSVTVFFTPADPDAPLEPVLARIRAATAGFAGIAPDTIVAVAADAVPKTSIGKIQKSLLQRALAEGALAPAYTRPEQSAERVRPVTAWTRTWSPAAVRPDPQERSAVDIVPLDGDAARAEIVAAAFRGAGIATRVRSVDACVSALAAGEAAPRLLVLGDAAGGAPTRLLPLLAAATRVRGALRIVATGRAAQRTAGDEVVDPDAAAVIALLRTAALENPQLRVRHVDCAGVLPATDDVARRLLDELSDAAREPEVAWRGAQRVASRLGPATPSGLGGTPLVPNGLNVIVGGLGGIGAHVATHLVQTLGARVVVVGRRAEDALAPASAARLAALRDVAGARVRYAALDIARPDAARALDGLLAETGRPDGILHLATDLRSAPLAEVTADELDAALAVKHVGGRVLIEAATRHGIGLVVLFSSVNGLFGGAEYGVYAAAARAQQALAEGATGAGGPEVRCLSWSMWEETGVSAGFRHAEATLRRGFDVIPPAQALAALDAALSLRRAVVHLGLDETRPHMRHEIAGAVQTLDELEVAAGDAGAEHRDAFGTAVPTRVAARAIEIAPTVSTAPAAATAAAPQASPLVARIGDIWRDVLALPKTPDAEDDVFALGASSLVMPRIQQRLFETLGIDIDVLDLFEHTTLGGLAHLVAARSAEAVHDEHTSALHEAE